MRDGMVSLCTPCAEERREKREERREKRGETEREREREEIERGNRERNRERRGKRGKRGTSHPRAENPPFPYPPFKDAREKHQNTFHLL